MPSSVELLHSPTRTPRCSPCQEFIKRNGQFTVNIGLCEAGVPILGVVGVPAAEEPRTYFAVKGGGAFVEVRQNDGESEATERSCHDMSNCPAAKYSASGKALIPS